MSALAVNYLFPKINRSAFYSAPELFSTVYLNLNCKSITITADIGYASLTNGYRIARRRYVIIRENREKLTDTSHVFGHISQNSSILMSPTSVCNVTL